MMYSLNYQTPDVFSKLVTQHILLRLRAGVAEPGGPGGPWPSQKFKWVGQGMFWPPQNFDHWPPKTEGPVVKIFPKLLLSTLKCAKFQKMFACCGLIRVELIPLVISSFKAEDYECASPCNYLT